MRNINQTVNPARVVYNGKHGGFNLTEDALNWLLAHGIRTGRDTPRHHPGLVQCVLELGDDANGRYCRLKIHTLKGRYYRIDEYDGLETVVEREDDNWIDSNCLEVNRDGE